MNSNDIRKGFLDFFAGKGHTIVKSASLVPDNDPTLLFTNAGMNQFKDIFLGTGKRDYSRAADTQKCMRVSGKHNDLEDVGKDTYHHTFFEMLGNWSFGDYYKKEAIEWAWELLTQIWKLPKERLYATVHHTDDEAFKIWENNTNIDKNHIIRFGDKDNFWEMGTTGPCGPCSEIHIDQGEGTCNRKHIKDHVCSVNAGCSRYIELWNLVFIQYNRLEDGTLVRLPSCHVDTGMGFERIVSVIQGRHSNYDTDLFMPLIHKIEDMSGSKYNGQTAGTKNSDMPVRVIADHIRSLTFAMADGVMPSNEGRGYVIRKILRRAIRYGKYLGFNSPFLFKIVDTVIDIMGNAFPEISEKAGMVKSLILSEEESFFKTLNRGLEKLDEIVSEIKGNNLNKISGEHIFMLYDSLGFPVDFTQNVAEDEGLKVDMERFRELMEEQKERARANWKGEAFEFVALKGIVKPTEYIGEDCFESEEEIQIIVKDNKIVDAASENDNAVIIARRTPFYAEKGGQVGDTGIIKKDQSRFIVNDTRTFNDVTLHFGTVQNGSFKTNERITMKVDKDKKNATARNHTATHLIHKALRHIAGEHAAQAGSLVGPERLRFDFTHPKALTKEEIEKIENEVNEVVLRNIPVKITKMSKGEAVKSGAVAIFEEKYGEVVRVVEVEGYSKELCGGTHVKQSGDIGLIKITADFSISAGTRRLEAFTGLNSLEEYRREFYKIKELSGLLNIDDEKLLPRFRQILDTIKIKDKEIEELKNNLAKSNMDELLKKPVMVGNSQVVITRVDMDSQMMLSIVDEFKKNTETGVIYLIGSPSADKVAITAGVTKTLINKIKAGDLARETAKIVGGGGGGRPDMAQAGGKDPSRIDDAVAKAREMIEQACRSVTTA